MNKFESPASAGYDSQLQELNAVILRMGGLAEAQLSAAVEALQKRSEEMALRVVRGDQQIDALEQQLDTDVVTLLALRQPVVGELREVLSALKIASDLERIGDYAANVAKRTVALAQIRAVPAQYAIPRMAGLVLEIINDVLDAYNERDEQRALDVWHRDAEVDELYTGLFRELLTYMMEDPRYITPCTHLAFIAKNIERIGDHATNIAETVYFLKTGQRLTGGRPKGDTSSFAVVQPPKNAADNSGNAR